jgi:hypothetical protein
MEDDPTCDACRARGGAWVQEGGEAAEVETCEDCDWHVCEVCVADMATERGACRCVASNMGRA